MPCCVILDQNIGKSCTKLGQLAGFASRALLMSSTGQQEGVPKLHLGSGW